jgi:hypothetical protein
VIIIRARIRTRSGQIAPLEFEVSVDVDAGIAYDVIATVVSATEI